MLRCTHNSVFRCALFLLPLLALFGCREMPQARPGTTGGVIFENKYVRYEIRADGRNEHWVDRRTGRDYAVPNTPCARVKKGGKDYHVTAATFKDGLLTTEFGEANVEARIRVSIKKTYLLWEVASLNGTGVEEFVFADVPLTLKGTPDEPFASSALALNLQTLVPGFPQPVSRLTASCFPRFGFAGAQVALVGCPPVELRSIIQEVVTNAPALPKSSLGGPWAWDAPSARGSYLFDFGNLNEKTVDDWIKL